MSPLQNADAGSLPRPRRRDRDLWPIASSSRGSASSPAQVFSIPQPRSAMWDGTTWSRAYRTRLFERAQDYARVRSHPEVCSLWPDVSAQASEKDLAH